MSTRDAPPAATPANDNATLWGVFGIVFGLCCLPLGVVFAALSFKESKRSGTRPTLAYAGFVVSTVVLAAYLVLYATGRLDFSLSVG